MHDNVNAMVMRDHEPSSLTDAELELDRLPTTRTPEPETRDASVWLLVAWQVFEELCAVVVGDCSRELDGCSSCLVDVMGVRPRCAKRQYGFTGVSVVEYRAPQRCVAPRIDAVNFCTAFKQQFHYCWVIILASEVQRGVAAIVRSIEVRTAIDQANDSRDISLLGCIVERGPVHLVIHLDTLAFRKCVSDLQPGPRSGTCSADSHIYLLVLASTLVLAPFVGFSATLARICVRSRKVRPSRHSHQYSLEGSS